MTNSPRIDFYVLQNQSPNGRYKLACRITEKAYLSECKIYLRTNNIEESQLLDDLLWTFSQSSFVPHDLNGEADSKPSPVLIGIEPPKNETIDIDTQEDWEYAESMASYLGLCNMHTK